MNKYKILGWFALSVMIMSFWSCKSQKTASSGGKLAFENITHDDFGGPLAEGEFVIQNASDIETVNAKKFPDVKAINFDETTLIALSFGEKPTGGYHCEIIKVEEYKDKVIVFYMRNPPDKKAIVSQAFTYPWHLIRLEKIRKEVHFEQIKEEEENNK